MWKVGGTKIELTRARYIFLPLGHVNPRKSDFLGKALRTRKFPTGKLFGATNHGILTHSGFRKCCRFGWPSLCFEVTGAQSEAISQKRVFLQKMRPVAKKCHSANFGPIAVKFNQPGLQVYESSLIEWLLFATAHLRRHKCRNEGQLPPPITRP